MVLFQIRLTEPISKDMVARRTMFNGGMMINDSDGLMDSDEVYASQGYMDPNSFISNTCVKAMYDYKANKSDELSFNKDAVITNVNKQEGGWWRGDLHGKKQQWFPANFVMV